MNLATRDGRRRLFVQVMQLLEAINALEPDRPDDKPSTPLVGAMLETMTNERVIALLRTLLESAPWRAESLKLSRRSDLFDKLIIMKGQESDWVLRLHTYNLTASKRGRFSNLGNELQDDEENTHLHRWRLSSRFVSGGFNNVTWDEAEVHDEHDRSKLIKYRIPATAKTKASEGGRKPEPVAVKSIKPRRSEFYRAGDVVTYPILDPHSVNTDLSPLTGTTMTLAHTGKGLIEDSYFFADAKPRAVVPQLAYNDETLIEAITLAITRLQLVELNKALAASDPRFRHLNAFETELMPRLPEYALLVLTTPAHERPDETELARLVDLRPEHVLRALEMDAAALGALIFISQTAIEREKFAKDAQELQRDFPVSPLPGHALNLRQHRDPVNLIGPRRK